MPKSGYNVKQGDIFGRIGSEIGRGLSEQIPKEVERNRLASGLDKFGQNAQNMNPFQRLAGFYGIPGAADRPELIRSGTQYLNQIAQGQALADQQKLQNEKPSPFPIQPIPQNTENNIPSITKEKPLEEIQRGYIPPTQDQIFEDAGKRFNSNKALYNYDPQKAIEAAENDAFRKEKIYEAYQKQHESLIKLEDNVKGRLQQQSTRLGASAIPSKLYDKIESKAIQAVKPKNEGGEGLTENQAIKKYGGQLDDAAKDYKKILPLTGISLLGRTSDETLRTLKGLQSNAQKRGDTEELADTLVSDLNLSPKVAYSIAEPISNVPEANRFIKNLANLEKFETIAETKPDLKIAVPKTIEIAPELAKMLKANPNLSPLAIANEIERKGYDPQTWLDYLSTHKDELGLTEAQGRQIDTPQNLLPTWQDWWFGAWTGMK